MQQLRILLVEDNPADVVLVREALSSQGLQYELTVAEDGRTALSIIEQIGHSLPPPDLAIIDLNLPKVDGAELLEAVRQNPAWAETPTLIMTSSRSPRDLAMIQKYGASYFHKPLELTEYFKIADVVKSLVGYAT